MPIFPRAQFVNSLVLSPASPESLGNELGAILSTYGATTWPTANKAIFVPIRVYEPLLIVKMFVENGATVAGNIDVGIYTLRGIKMVSSGSTLQSITGTIQEFDITDTLLESGIYYLAVAMSNVTGTIGRWSISPLSFGRVHGVAEQTSAFPLPNTASFSPLSSQTVPLICATSRTVI